MAGIPGVMSHLQGAATPQPRLVKAAHEFEAQLMKELLKPMAHGADTDGDPEGGGGPMEEYASEALGQAISARGGLGIANSIIGSLCRNVPSSEAGSNMGTQKKELGQLRGGGFK